MLEEYSDQTFPTDKNQALTLLYMKDLDLTRKTPEDVAAIYHVAYQRISKWFSDKSYEDVTFLE